MSNLRCPRSVNLNLALGVAFVATTAVACGGGSAGGSGGTIEVTGGAVGNTGGTPGATGGMIEATGGAVGTTGGTIGTGGNGGTGGTGGTGGSSGTPAGTSGQSCKGLAATCGPAGNESCCTSLQVPGGTFYRSYDGASYTDKGYPATVSDFVLDKYEVTVGRFRAFVNAGMGTQASPPAAGAGAHPVIAGSGWTSAWNAALPADTASLQTSLKCQATSQTWTDAAGANESRPQNCLNWYLANAFCAWDGGRLPTEAEWNYAAAGGSEQRAYPWSSPATSTTIDATYAVYYCGGSCTSPQNVGMKPSGNGRWGHADLAGNVVEWTLDWYVTPYLTPCSDCGSMASASASYRVYRGGSFNGYPSDLRSAYRGNHSPGEGSQASGARCARNRL